MRVETVEKAVELSKDDLVDTDAIRMIGEGWKEKSTELPEDKWH